MNYEQITAALADEDIQRRSQLYVETLIDYGPVDAETERTRVELFEALVAAGYDAAIEEGSFGQAGAMSLPDVAKLRASLLEFFPKLNWIVERFVAEDLCTIARADETSSWSYTPLSNTTLVRVALVAAREVDVGSVYKAIDRYAEDGQAFRLDTANWHGVGPSRFDMKNPTRLPGSSKILPGDTVTLGFTHTGRW